MVLRGMAGSVRWLVYLRSLALADAICMSDHLLRRGRGAFGLRRSRT